MKHTLSSVFGLAVLAGVSLGTSASAVVSIDYVSVGNAGNANDGTSHGAVAYNYQIAKNETTICQSPSSSMRRPRATPTRSITPA